MSDWRTLVEHYVCGVRATALIVRERHLLLVKDASGIYYTIGGAVKVDETSEEALKREIYEEVGALAKKTQLAFVAENFFEVEGQKYHNVEFHYWVELEQAPKMWVFEDGTYKECVWIPLETLHQYDVRPAFLKEKLPHWQQLEHIINKGV